MASFFGAIVLGMNSSRASLIHDIFIAGLNLDSRSPPNRVWNWGPQRFFFNLLIFGLGGF